MNKAESDRLAAALEEMGLVPVGSVQDADIVILNTCVVRQSAEDKATGMLGMLKSWRRQSPRRFLALTGCLVGPSNGALSERFGHVDVFARPGEYEEIASEIGRRVGSSTRANGHDNLPLKPPVATYVPITRGCDLMCAYCVIPYRRGRQVSRPVDEVVAEVETLVLRGARQVTLLGQTVDLYGHDLPGKPDLADLLRAVNAVSGLRRIRFLTSHPKHMTERIIRAIADSDKVCEHINLPVQSGSDQVLERMRRGYTSADYMRLVQTVRATIPGVALSTDVIVGFPGETEGQFIDTVRLLEELRFDKVHVAAYSPRPGTIAQRTMANDVPQEEKERRRRMVEDLEERTATEINRGLLGKRVEVLVEGRHKGMWQGRTRTDKLVFFPFERDEDLAGSIVGVQIERASPWSLKGSTRQPSSVRA